MKKWRISILVLLAATLSFACPNPFGINTDTTPTHIAVYDANGADGGKVPVEALEYKEGAQVTVLDNTGSLSKNGYGFTGWNTASDGSGTHFRPGDSFTMGKSDVTLYTHWAVVHHVSYDPNSATSGSVPTDSNGYVSGAKVTALFNTGDLVRTNYTFIGWAIQADGSGLQYSGGESFTMGDADVTLYARWTQSPTYKVIYNANNADGGAPPTDTNNYESGMTVTVSDNSGNLTLAGFSFSGWNTSADGSGDTYAAGETFALSDANVMLYAKWTLTPRSVTYASNGATSGSAPIDSKTYKLKDTVKVLDNTGSLARTAYSFDGWNTAADGSGNSYLPGATFEMGTADVTLYAKWKAVPHMVVYDPNRATSGNVPVDSNTYLPEETVTALANSGTLGRLGYTFDGWNTAGDDSGSSYTPGTQFSMGTADVTLFARWNSALWGRTIGTSLGASLFKASAVDADGNIYAVGSQRGTGTFNYGGSAAVAGPSSDVNALLVKYNSSGVAQWARSVTGGTGASEFLSVAVDSTGNVYVGGYTTGAEQYGLGPGYYTNPIGPSTEKNALIVKYDGTGATKWARYVESVEYGASSRFYSIAFSNPDSSVYAAGFNGPGTFTYNSSGTVEATGVSSGGNAIIVKYDLNGVPGWAHTMTADPTEQSMSWFEALAVDSTGNIYAGGIQYGNATCSYDGKQAASTYEYNNLLLVKYNGNGTSQWARSISASNRTRIYSLAVDSSNYVYAAGNQWGSNSFTYSDGVSVAGSGSGANCTLVKYDSSGKALWARSAAGSSISEFFAVAVDSSNYVYAAGTQVGTGTFTYGSGVSAIGTATDRYNAALVKYNASGTAQWARSTDIGSNDSQLKGLAVAQGNIVAVGYQAGTHPYLYSSDVRLVGASSSENVLVVKYKP